MTHQPVASKIHIAFCWGSLIEVSNYEHGTYIFEANTQMVVLKGGHCCMPPFYLLSHAVKWRNKLHFLVIAIFTATKRPRGRLLQSVSGLYLTLFAKFSMFHIFTLLFVKNCLKELRSGGVLTIALVQISCTYRTSLNLPPHNLVLT